MIRATAEVSLAALAVHDAIIDVRSPSEFAEDHLPGAVNLPVLTDAERAEVGALYVRKSKFLARRLGAAMVARNIAAHLDGALADRDGSFRPLVHCWRGGQRSGAMAEVMSQVGWPVTVLHGGYRTWRRAVVARLYDRPLAHPLVLIDGPTGVGKTALLARLAEQGVQTLDLEALANHRGSLFGARPGGQPPQTLFESRLHAALETLDPARPVAVEAESSRIGRLTLPPSLWAAMKAAPAIEVTAPLEARIANILADYAEIGDDPEALDAALTRLPRHHSKATISEWRRMARTGELAPLTRALIEAHYDPAYARSSSKRSPAVRLPVEDDAAIADALATLPLSP